MSWSSQVLETLAGGCNFPLIVTPTRPTPLIEFAEERTQEMDAALAEHGAVLFRGFDLSGEATLSTLFRTVWAAPLFYVYRSTPRTAAGEGVYTATEYPASQEIPMHNENSYQSDWPMRLGFHCVCPAERGGQTPLADIARVTERIGIDLVSEFGERRVSYVRNYSDFIDLPWQIVFQTESREQVEAYCRDHDISFEWSEDGLRTSQICQGTAVHPTIKKLLWFNQAQLFHVSALGAEMATSMIDMFGEDRLPRNAYFGDGGEIPERIVRYVNEAFEREKVVFDWQKDDVLILDNMRLAHGRKPFSGQRRVLVSMGLPYSTVMGDR